MESACRTVGLRNGPCSKFRALQRAPPRFSANVDVGQGEAGGFPRSNACGEPNQGIGPTSCSFPPRQRFRTPAFIGEAAHPEKNPSFSFSFSRVDKALATFFCRGLNALER